MKEMPFYICHKRVQALEIEKVGSYVQTLNGLMRNIWFVGDDHWELFPDQLFARSVPEPGDFLVRYADGYESFSPRRAFLEGYQREEVVEALPHRIDQAIAKDAGHDLHEPYPTDELIELLVACRAEIVRLRGHTDGNVLMERLNDLATTEPGSASPPEWLRAMDWASAIKRVAREAYVTINSLKHQVEQARQQIERLQADVIITRQMAGFKEVKNAKTDQA